jgi:mxaJ protein
MSSSFRRWCFALLFVAAPLLWAEEPFTVCADPQNPPFSTRKQSGFENRIANAIAAELHEPIRFHWSRMGRGFVREIVNKGACDAVISVPVGIRGLRVTAPYYRSTYVFVTRRADTPLSSLDDPRLAGMKIGVQVLEDDYAPPARALARRNLTKNVVGFEMDENAGEIMSAVAKGKVDTAIVWGPLAGYYARRYGSKLRITPVTPEMDPPRLPFTFEMGVGVRKSNPELYGRLNEAVQRAQPQIRRILREFNVPTLPLETSDRERKGQ